MSKLTLNTENFMEVSDAEFLRCVKHFRLAAKTRKEMWDGELGFIMKGLRKYWYQYSNSKFSEACYNFCRDGKMAAFVGHMREIEREYLRFLPRQRVMFAAMESSFTESSFITLSIKVLKKEKWENILQSFSKDELSEYIRSGDFDPRDFCLWISHKYDLEAFKSEVTESEIGHNIWKSVLRFASTKRFELMTGNAERVNNLSCYFLAQAVVKNAVRTEAYLERKKQWELDRLDRANFNAYAASSESAAKYMEERIDKEIEFESQIDTCHTMIELCEDFAGHMHGVVQPSFAYAHEKVVSPDGSYKYKPVYSKEDALRLNTIKMENKAIAVKEERDAEVLESIDRIMRLEHYG